MTLRLNRVTSNKEGIMKQLLRLLVLASMLTAPALAFAAENTGIYVAPKLVFGSTTMDGMKTQWGEGSDPGINSNIGDKDEGSFGGALAVGYDFNRKFMVPIRAELEYSAFTEVEGKRSQGFSGPFNGRWTAKQTFQVQTLFLNTYYDFHNSSQFTPYVGAGVGMAFIGSDFSFTGEDYDTPETSSGTSGSNTSSNFAWNIGAGLGYEVNEHFTVDLGYRFVGLGEAKSKWIQAGGEPWSRGKADDLYMHQLVLGARVTF